MSDDTEITDVGDQQSVKTVRRDRVGLEHEEGIALSTLMATEPGRRFMYDLLEACHIYATSYSDNAARMAFQEGERNVGLRLVAAIQRSCPQRYNEMVLEAHERSRPGPKPTGQPTSFDPDKPFGGAWDWDSIR